MISKRNGKTRLRATRVGIAVSSVFLAVLYIHPSGSAQTSTDVAGSARAFLEAAPVYLHPRCANCHPRSDAPLQGDDSRPHLMNVKRGADGKGKSTMRCSNCHQTANLTGPHMPPGDPDWHLPPEAMPMVFEKKIPKDLCLQLKDPAQNGNRTPKEILEHLRTSLVLWGWNPGEGRTPVPISYEIFMKHMTEWVEKGAACPD